MLIRNVLAIKATKCVLKPRIIQSLLDSSSRKHPKTMNQFQQTIICSIVLFGLALATVEGKYYGQCPSDQGQMISLAVDGCDDSLSVCPLIKNKNATIRIEFQSSKLFIKKLHFSDHFSLNPHRSFCSKGAGSHLCPNRRRECLLAHKS